MLHTTLETKASHLEREEKERVVKSKGFRTYRGGGKVERY